MTERQFPVLWQGSRFELQGLTKLDYPRTIPWSLIAPHEAQAQRNHGQSLERLAQRGGLSPLELCAVLSDKHWSALRGWGDITMVPLLQRIIAERTGAERG